MEKGEGAMNGKITVISLSLLINFVLAAVSGGFDNNANRLNPNNPDDKSLREYTREHSAMPIGQGGYYGGHDTLTAEGIMLKKQVHKNDPDGGTKFYTFTNEALLGLRTGAHDEDTNRLLNLILNDPPIGSNGWGDFFHHFYNPDTGKGLKGFWTPATIKAKDYSVEIRKKIGCGSDAISKLSQEDKQKVYDMFGRILHLLEDMGQPAHTNDDIHVFTKTFEKYVNDNWADIVNSNSFKKAVTPEEYLKGNYEISNADNPEQFLKTLASISKNYYTDNLGTISAEQLRENADVLIPQTIKFTAGYIDAIYKKMQGSGTFSTTKTPQRILLANLGNNILMLAQLIGGASGAAGAPSPDCPDPPPEPVDPAGDHPDDRFDVSDEFYWEKEFQLTEADLTSLYLKTAIKKGKIGLWYKKQAMEILIKGRAQYMDAPQEIKDRIEAEFRTTMQKLEQRKDQAESDWKGAPDIALLTSGFYKPSISLMLKIGEPVSFTGIDFDPVAVKEHPVFLVPTGGFSGLENSDALKARIEEYVKNGGTLIAFAQQHGADYRLLPGAIAGYGYQEDQSCHWASAYVETFHPILSNLSTSTPDIGLDGYFTIYPENATVLLRRTANGQPVMIMYPYGSGHVVATTLYTDFAFTHGQANTTEINLIRDMISWAKKPATMLEVRPEENASLDIIAANFTDIHASSARVIVYSPDRSAPLAEHTITLSLYPGQSAPISISYQTTLNSPTGIYHVDYALYDYAQNIIQPQAETDSGRFVVANPLANPYKSPDFNFSIQTTSEQYAYGSAAIFTVLAWNNTNINHTLRFTYSLPHLGPDGTYTLAVPAMGSASFNITVPEVKASGWLCGIFYDEMEKAVGSAKKGIWMYYPSANVTAQTDKATYSKNENVNLTLNLQNQRQESYATTMKVTVADTANSVIYLQSFALFLAGGGTSSQSLNFALPANLQAGSYIISAEAFDTRGGKIGGAFTTFDVPKPILSVVPVLPEQFSLNNMVAFNINNIGVAPVSSSILSLFLKDLNETEVWSSQEQVPPLNPGQTTTVTLSIPISNLLLGNYKLGTVLHYEGESQTNETAIPNSVALTLSLDKPLYRIREVANLTVKLTNKGRFSLESISLVVSIPALQYTSSRTTSLGVSPGAVSFSYEVPIAVGTPAGQHDVGVLLSLPSGSSLTQNSKIVIPGSELIIRYTGGPSPAAGDAINLEVENTGGVDTGYITEELTLTDNRGVEIYRGNVTGTIFAGETKPLTGFQIPSQTAESLIFLRVRLRDTATGKLPYLYKALESNGLKAELSVRTDKTSYLTTEAVTALHTLTSGRFSIENGSMNIQVKGYGASPQEGFTHFLPLSGWWPFKNPSGVAVGADGYLYVADRGNHRIQKFNSTGKFITQWGSQCKTDLNWDGIPEQSCEGQFNQPYGIAVGPSGHVYVADTYNDRVQKFDGDGKFIGQWGTYCNTDMNWDGQPDQSCAGQFNKPQGIAIGPDGSLYVADTFNNRIQKFDGQGRFISQWGSYCRTDTDSDGQPDQPCDGRFNAPYAVAIAGDGSIYVADGSNQRIQKFNSGGTFVASWGSKGNGDGQFSSVVGLAISSDGSVFAVDSGNRIQKFDSNGAFQAKWGSKGSGAGQFYYPYGIAVAPDGSIYVTDSGNNRIQKCFDNGTFITGWGSGGSGNGQFNDPIGIATASDSSVYVVDSSNQRIQKFDKNGKFLRAWGSEGNGDGQFYYPYSIAIAPDGVVYVSDSGNDRIQKFESSGEFILQWGSGGVDVGQFIIPDGLAIAPDGSVYVVDTYNNRVQKFDPSGNFLSHWGGFCRADTDWDGIPDRPCAGQFNKPQGIAIAPDGSIYITDSGNNRIQKFSSDGEFLSQWGSQGSGDGQFVWPYGIAVAPDGSVYVVDTYNSRIQKFNSNGEFIAKWGTYGDGEGQFDEPLGIAIAPDSTVYVVDSYNSRIQRMPASSSSSGKIFEATLPITQSALTSHDYINPVGKINATGKFYLEATLANGMGQVLAKEVYPFYIIRGDLALMLSTDKKAYKPGEEVTITGSVENRAALEMVDVVLSLTSQSPPQTSRVLYTETFNIPAGGTQPFSATTIAGNEGTVILTGAVSQAGSILEEIKDQYEVATPKMSAVLSIPEVVGNDSFLVSLEIRNEGTLESSATLQSSIDNQIQTLSIPAGFCKTPSK